MEAVRFFVEDILSGVIRTQDLPLNDFKYGEPALNRPGSLTARIPLTSSFATEEMLDPYRTAIYAVRGGRVEWGGILLPPSLGLAAENLDISCTGWSGYFDRRNIRSLEAQPEAGGVLIALPAGDDTTTNVFGNPNAEDLFQDVRGGYAPQQGIVSSPTAGVAPSYRATFDVPTISTLHPIESLTLNIVATRSGDPRTLTPWVKIGASSYSGTPTVVGGAPYQVFDCSYTWTTNPATGVAWTVADVNAFASANSAGYSTDNTTSGYDTVVNQLALTVRYSAGYSDFFTATDQFDIFRALVRDAQSVERFGVGYELGIDVVYDAPSGVLRDRVTAYQAWQAKNLGDALRQLAALEDGFDFAPVYSLNATSDRIDKAIKLYYPRKGRDTGFLFEYDRNGPPTNVIARGFADPVDFAWAGDGWGSGNDDTRLRSPYIDESLRNVYPPFDAAPSWSSVIEQDTLDDNTAAWFARHNRPHRVPVVRVDPDKFPRWGDYETGDVANFRIIDGYGSTGLVPQANRIIGWSIDDDTNFDLVLSDPLGEATDE